jgi:hypothetical protein
MSSLANGQGDNAVHGLLRYKLRREERRAAGFAELLSEIDAVSGVATQWVEGMKHTARHCHL